MPRWKLIVVTRGQAGGIGADLRCRQCGRKLEVAEEAWIYHADKRARYYCKGCYRKVWWLR